MVAGSLTVRASFRVAEVDDPVLGVPRAARMGATGEEERCGREEQSE
jgi:hypothetical protein